MGILDDLQADIVSSRSCKAARFIATLSDEEQQELEQVLQSDYSTERILRVLKRRGALLSHDALYKHRRGTCCCGD